MIRLNQVRMMMRIFSHQGDPGPVNRFLLRRGFIELEPHSYSQSDGQGGVWSWEKLYPAVPLRLSEAGVVAMRQAIKEHERHGNFKAKK